MDRFFDSGEAGVPVIRFKDKSCSAGRALVMAQPHINADRLTQPRVRAKQLKIGRVFWDRRIIGSFVFALDYNRLAAGTFELDRFDDVTVFVELDLGGRIRFGFGANRNTGPRTDDRHVFVLDQASGG